MTNKELLKKIAELEAKIKSLETREVHHHYHYDYQYTQPVQPSPHINPPIWYGPTCSTLPPAATGGLRIDTVL